MTLGVAFSGGDLVGVLGAICQSKWLDRVLPGSIDEGSDVLVSTVSGGSMGYGIMANNGDHIFAPHYDPDISLVDASNPFVESGMLWMGAGLLNKTLAGLLEAAVDLPHNKRRRSSIGGDAWTMAVDALMLDYGIDPASMDGGPVDWYVNFAEARKSDAPLKLGASPIGKLQNGARLTRDLHGSSVTQTVGYSSSFWAMHPMFSTKPMLFDLQSLFLPQDDEFYFADGGVTDVTAITTLLKNQATSVIAFFNMCEEMRDDSWMVGTLFGKNPPKGNTNPTNVGRGNFTQVFPSEFGDEVIANLTNPNIMRARLTNVQVVENKWLGIKSYTLKTLIIFSSMKSKEFLGSFKDQEIPKLLSPTWPDGFSFSMLPIDANMFCMLQDWKLEKYRDELQEALEM